MEFNTVLCEWFVALKLNVAFLLKSHNVKAVHSFESSETARPIMHRHIQQKF
jgi:hypothetical protein